MSATEQWQFFTIGLWVTGKGEERFLPAFFRSLEETGRCHFVVKRKIGQLSPRSQKRKQRMVGKGQTLSSRQEELALSIRGFLDQSPANLAVVIDDLEERKPFQNSVFETYREPLDRMLRPRQSRDRASVHFFVPMIEAYFLADAATVNDVLGLSITEVEGDPEEIRGPKGKLKKYCQEAGRSYNERLDGEKIAGRVDLAQVLVNPDYCASLRSLVKWCSRRVGEEDGVRYQLVDGRICELTGEQIDPPAS